MPSVKSYDDAQALVAHPNPQLAGYLRQYLREKGFGTIIVANHSGRAVKCLNILKTKLIIVDYDLMEFGGPDFTRFIRLCDAPLQEAAVCVTIARPNRDKVLAARDSGANEIIALPLTYGSLDKKITNAIKNPAPFIRHPAYTGPCRRRMTLEDWGNIERRHGDA
jgi:DNA-binding response OmpR family regulator